MKDYLGLYFVNDKVYTDKIEAILEANTTKAEITWDFHQPRFRRIDWTKEPELSLSELYKIRAQQLRDQYDYLIVMFSGGADSTNMLNSFLINNIPVDEIVASIPISGLKGFKATTDQDAGNNASEWLLTTTPFLKFVSQKFPNIKISINDFFENMLEFKTDEWLYESSDHVHPTTSARYSLEKLNHIKKLADQGKTIGILYGIEKPSLSLWEGKVISTIYDLTVNVPRKPFKQFYQNVDIVLFYTTPSMPEIVVKQSHEVMKKIHSMQKFKAIRDLIFDNGWSEDKKNTFEHGVYQRAIVPIIYPDIDMSTTFQALKAKNYFMAAHDNWFHSLHKETRLHQLIVSDFNLFFKSIDPKYYRSTDWSKGVGFKTYANHYVIGNVDQFKNNSYQES
jgi:hypothetical protein